MTSIQSISSPLSLSAIRSPQNNPGLKPISWKIRPSVETNAPSTADSFVRQSPVIRSLDPQKLPQTAIPEPELTRRYLFKALDQALKSLPAGVDLKQVHP